MAARRFIAPPGDAVPGREAAGPAGAGVDDERGASASVSRSYGPGWLSRPAARCRCCQHARIDKSIRVSAVRREDMNSENDAMLLPQGDLRLLAPLQPWRS